MPRKSRVTKQKPKEKPRQTVSEEFRQRNKKSKSSRLKSRRNLQRNIEIQLETFDLDYPNLQITDYKYVEKEFMDFRHKLNRSQNNEMFDSRTNESIWRLFMSTTMKFATHLDREYQQKFDRVQEHELRRSRRCPISS